MTSARWVYLLGFLIRRVGNPDADSRDFEFVSRTSTSRHLFPQTLLRVGAPVAAFQADED
jgi:hypothetical protein